MHTCTLLLLPHTHSVSGLCLTSCTCEHTRHCPCVYALFSTSVHLFTGPSNSTVLPPSPRRHSRTAASCTDSPAPTSSTPPTTSEGVSDAALTQLLVIVIAVVACTVLLLVVVVVLVVVIVVVVCKRRGKEEHSFDCESYFSTLVVSYTKRKLCYNTCLYTHE